MIVRLDRSLYGSKQASRTWHQRLVRGMKYLGFEQCASEACVVRLMENGTIAIVVVVHVDDIFEKFHKDLREYVPISSLGELRLYTGIRFLVVWL